MPKPVPTTSIRIETWTRGRGTATPKEITKVAVRHADGKFHGATNFRMRVGDSTEYR